MNSQQPSFRSSWQSLPIWGTFLILLVFLLAGVSWGCWSLYDHFIRQPRIAADSMQQQDVAEMRELYKQWDLSVRQVNYSKSLIGMASQGAEKDIRIANESHEMADVPGADTPEIREIKRRSEESHQKWISQHRRDAANEDRYWREKYEECSQKMQALDRQSRERFGVPASELPSRFGP